MPAEITKLPTNLPLRVEQTLRQRPHLFLPAALLPVTCLSVLQTACTAKTCLQVPVAHNNCSIPPSFAQLAQAHTTGV